MKSFSKMKQNFDFQSFLKTKLQMLLKHASHLSLILSHNFVEHKNRITVSNVTDAASAVSVGLPVNNHLHKAPSQSSVENCTIALKIVF